MENKMEPTLVCGVEGRKLGTDYDEGAPVGIHSLIPCSAQSSEAMSFGNVEPLRLPENASSASQTSAYPVAVIV